MPKGHKFATLAPPLPQLAVSADCRGAIHWFSDSVGRLGAAARGLFASDFSDELEAVLEAAILNMKSRGIMPLTIGQEALFKQADDLWQLAVRESSFGRPAATQVELDIAATDLLIVKGLEAPERAHHLWYLFHHVIYPRALLSKPTLITSPLQYHEFINYAAACDDLEFAGRKVTFEKLLWTLDASAIDLQQFQLTRAENLPPLLKAEYYLYRGLKERGLEVVLQHLLGDYTLDMAVVDGAKRIAIEIDVFASIDQDKISATKASRNYALFQDGWKILRFTTAEILSNLTGCIDAVAEVWQQGRKKTMCGRLITGGQGPAAPELPVADDAQRLAIAHGGGPAAVEGAAGTGKTTCIMKRVAYLLAQGVNPEKILVLTHSADAARILKSALETVTDRQLAQKVDVFGWHDLGLKLLRENLGAVRRRPPLKIENNPLKVIQRLLVKYKRDRDPVMMELGDELDEFTLTALISLYKANLVTAKHLHDRAKSSLDQLAMKVYQSYDEHLQKANRIDKDDMIAMAAQMLVDHADIRARYQYQYEFVLVDEYQEATAASDLLARLLAFPQDNIYFAGDEDQCLFEGKGSLPKLMSEVSIRLPNARCYLLENNWRSHPLIVEHASGVRNGLTRRRIAKQLTPGWGETPSVAIVGPQLAENAEAECEWVAEEILLLIDSGRLADEIAVGFHSERYQKMLEEALLRRGVRCLAANPQIGFVPDEIGDIMAFLRLVMDPDGPKARESFERVCQLRVSEVDPKLSATIASFAETNNLSYLKAVEIYSEAAPEQSCLDLKQLVRIIRTMHQEALPPAESIALLKRTQRLGEYYRSQKVPPGVTYEPLRQLSRFEEEARKFKDVAEFVKNYTARQAGSASGSGEHRVNVFEVSALKGKEYPVIFLLGLAQELFPDLNNDPEEERRLFYMAMTRARELLYLSAPIRQDGKDLELSPFLADAGLRPIAPVIYLPAIEAPAIPPFTVVPPQQVELPVPQEIIPPHVLVDSASPKNFTPETPFVSQGEADPAIDCTPAANSGALLSTTARKAAAAEQIAQRRIQIRKRRRELYEQEINQANNEQSEPLPVNSPQEETSLIAGISAVAPQVTANADSVDNFTEKPMRPHKHIIDPLEEFLAGDAVTAAMTGGDPATVAETAAPASVGKSNAATDAGGDIAASSAGNNPASSTTDNANGLVTQEGDRTLLAPAQPAMEKQESLLYAESKIMPMDSATFAGAIAPVSAPDASTLMLDKIFGQAPTPDEQEQLKRWQAEHEVKDTNRNPGEDQQALTPPIMAGDRQALSAEDAESDIADLLELASQSPSRQRARQNAARYVAPEPERGFDPDRQADCEPPYVLAPVASPAMSVRAPQTTPPAAMSEQEIDHSTLAVNEIPAVSYSQAANSAQTTTHSQAANSAQTTTHSQAANSAQTTTHSQAANSVHTSTYSRAANPVPISTHSQTPNPVPIATHSQTPNPVPATTYRQAANQVHTITPQLAADQMPITMHSQVAPITYATTPDAAGLAAGVGDFSPVSANIQAKWCKDCGAALIPGAKFCGECGASANHIIDAGAIGITEAQLAKVPGEALADSESFKRWMNAANGQRPQQSWMIKILKFLEL